MQYVNVLKIINHRDQKEQQGNTQYDGHEDSNLSDIGLLFFGCVFSQLVAGYLNAAKKEGCRYRKLSQNIL